jgi:hypothetical protein
MVFAVLQMLWLSRHAEAVETAGGPATGPGE